MNNKIVCSVVFNSISRDARVLKQAMSLSNAGYQVTILGVKDEKFNLSTEVLENGVILRRLDMEVLKSAAFFFVKAFILLLFALSIYLIVSTPHSLAFAVTFCLALMLGSFYYIQLFFKGISKASEENNAADSAGVAAKKLIILLKSIVSPILKLSWTFLRWISFIKLIWTVKPKIIHCHDVQTLPIGLLAKAFLRCRLIYDAHEIYEEVPQVLIENGARLKLFRRIHKISQGHIDYFITINESIARWYKENYPKLPEATIIMNATVLAPMVEYDGRLHEAANLEPGTKILLYQGGFSEHRGLDFLVRSAEHFPINWVLVMMGWGRYEEHLKSISTAIIERAKHNGRPDAVIRFIPPAPQSELVQWTAGGTIGIIPYENTGLNHWFCTPNKIWELPNAGLPVIVSSFPELRKPVDEYANGWLLPEKEDVYFIGRLLSTLTDDQLCNASLNSRKFVEANNWTVYEQRLFQLYERAITF